MNPQDITLGELIEVDYEKNTRKGRSKIIGEVVDKHEGNFSSGRLEIVHNMERFYVTYTARSASVQKVGNKQNQTIGYKAEVAPVEA